MKLLACINIALGLTCLLNFPPNVFGGKILFYAPFCAKSSTICYMPLAEILASRGHHVTVVTPWHKVIPKHQNLTGIVVKSSIEDTTHKISHKMLGKFSPMKVYDHSQILMKCAMDGIDNLFKQDDFIQMVQDKNQKFDVVVTSTLLITNEIGYYLAHRFNANLVLYSTSQAAMPTMSTAMGQPHNDAYIPNVMATFSHPMNFWQRVANTIGTALFQHVGRDWYILPKLEAILDEQFPDDPRPGRPSLLELEKQAALAFQFGHPLLMDGLRPLSPNYIMIGMMNCRPAKPLPPDLKKFMDEAKDGVIFVSFGSVLTASEMPDDMRKAMFGVFARLKQRVLMKWEVEVMEGKPDNVKLSKWLPQPDILAHPNLRLFVTHGGQSSSQEALCHQKPVVVIPVFGDQPANAAEAKRRGYGITLPLGQLTEESLYNAVNTVLNEPSYSNRAREHGQLLMDEMTQPIDRAIWWLEYAIRHPGMKHMRSPVHDLTWIQYFLLDVIAFITLVIAVLLSIGFLCCRCCYRTCCAKRGQKAKYE